MDKKKNKNKIEKKNEINKEIIIKKNNKNFFNKLWSWRNKKHDKNHNSKDEILEKIKDNDEDYIDKYKILIDLLKHQDSQINSLLTWNLVLQSSFLLTLMKLESVTNNKLSIALVQILGLICAFFWYLTGKKLKCYTTYYITQLKHFEEHTEKLNCFKIFRDGEKKIMGYSKDFYLKWIPIFICITWIFFLSYPYWNELQYYFINILHSYSHT